MDDATRAAIDGHMHLCLKVFRRPVKPVELVPFLWTSQIWGKTPFPMLTDDERGKLSTIDHTLVIESLERLTEAGLAAKKDDLYYAGESLLDTLIMAD